MHSLAITFLCGPVFLFDMRCCKINKSPIGTSRRCWQICAYMYTIYVFATGNNRVFRDTFKCLDINPIPVHMPMCVRERDLHAAQYTTSLHEQVRKVLGQPWAKCSLGDVKGRGFGKHYHSSFHVFAIKYGLALPFTVEVFVFITVDCTKGRNCLPWASALGISALLRIREIRDSVFPPLFGVYWEAVP